MNVLIWGWMLCKRLWKKATFLLILGLIPLLVFGFGILAEAQSGFVTVVLAAEDASDPLANAMTDRLLQERGLMRFVSCNSPAEAETLVRNGTVDGAWIFPADLQKRVEDFFDSSYRRKPLAVVLERESTVPLRLAREKLSGVLFECCSQQMFLDSVRAHSPEAQEWSDEALLEFYRNAFTPASHLFDFSLVGGGAPAEGETNYLMSPLRGLLAVVIVLAGFATAMYYVQDHRIGLFSWVSCRRLPYVELGYQTVSVLTVGIVCLLALMFSGLCGPLLREILVLLLYVVCVSVFSCLMRVLCRSLIGLGAVMPPAVVLMIALCPVFFELTGVFSVNLLLPPTYYINALYSNLYLGLMVAYTCLLWGVYRLLNRILPLKK